MNKNKLLILGVLTIFCVGMLMGSVCATDGYYHNVPKSKYTSVSANKILSKYGKTNIKVEKTGICTKVMDGDTIYVTGVGKVRLSQVDTPERGYKGYSVSSYFTKKLLLNKKVGVNIDSKQKKSYGRKIAVVIIKGRNFNKILLKERLARIMYFKKSEFNPYNWVGKSYTTKTFIKSKKKSTKSSKTKSSSKKGTYVASKNSKIRHFSNCKYVSKIKSYNKLTFKTKSAAIKAGKTKSCSSCHA